MSTALSVEWSTFWNCTIDCLTRANDQLVLEEPDFAYVLNQLRRIDDQRVKMVAVIHSEVEKVYKDK